MCLQLKTILRIMPDGSQVVHQVPCGHCIECLKDYQNGWKIRLSEEFSETCKGAFLTLTYEPSSAHLAFDCETGELVESDEFQELIENTSDNRVLSLDHTDFVGWIKRSREALCRAKGKRVPFKYFVCGEYGPRTLRPHGHCFILGLDYEDVVQFFVKDWTSNFGYCYATKVVYNLDKGKSPQRVANYVSKYCAKGSFENPRVVAGYVEKPKRTMSKGIGKHYAERFQHALLPDGFHDEFETDLPLLDTLYKYWSSTPKPTKTPFGDMIYHDPELRFAPFFESNYLDKILDLLKCLYTDEKGKTYAYKMPRYIRDKIVPPGTSLAKQLADRLQDRIVSDRFEKLEQIRAAHPRWSTMQATCQVVYEDICARKRRAENSRKALNNFYQLSNF